MTTSQSLEINRVYAKAIGRPGAAYFANFFQMAFEAIYTLSRAFPHRRSVFLQRGMSSEQNQLEAAIQREGLSLVFAFDEVAVDTLLCAFFFTDHEITGLSAAHSYPLEKLQKARIFSFHFSHFQYPFSAEAVAYSQAGLQLGEEGWVLDLGGRFRLDLLLTPKLYLHKERALGGLQTLVNLQTATDEKTEVAADFDFHKFLVNGWHLRQDLSGRFLFLQHDQLNSERVVGALVQSQPALKSSVMALSYCAHPGARIWSQWWENCPMPADCRGLVRFVPEKAKLLQHSLAELTQNLLKDQIWDPKWPIQG